MTRNDPAMFAPRRSMLGGLDPDGDYVLYSDYEREYNLMSERIQFLETRLAEIMNLAGDV